MALNLTHHEALALLSMAGVGVTSTKRHYAMRSQQNESFLKSLRVGSSLAQEIDDPSFDPDACLVAAMQKLAAYTQGVADDPN